MSENQMTKTLMLRFECDATEFAYQVPDQTYEAFKTYQLVIIADERKLAVIKKIENHAKKVQDDLFESIEKWKTKCHEELDMYDRLEASQIRAKEIFS